MTQITIQQAFDLAVRHHQAGRLGEAESIYRQVLAQQPNHAETLHMLGIMAHQVGQSPFAVELIDKAIAVDPDNPHYRNNIGLALTALRRFDEAIASIQTAIRLNPAVPEFHNNLGKALKERGNAAEAIAAFREAIRLRPTYATAHSNLGNTLKDAGRIDEAVAAHQAAVELSPSLAEVHYNLGVIMRDQGRTDEAMRSFRRAVELKPDLAEAHVHLGGLLENQGKLDDAMAAYRVASEIRPNLADAHNNIGNLLKSTGQVDHAVESFLKALAARPADPDILCNMGNAFKDRCELDAAIDCHRKALAIQPTSAAIHSSLLLLLHYDPKCSMESLRQEHRIWNQRHAKPLSSVERCRPIEPIQFDSEDPGMTDKNAGPITGKRLRIGYVSPDFREHVIGRTILSLLEYRDRERFEVFCYSNSGKVDAVCERIRKQSDAWRDISRATDPQAADLIRQDKIDILVDLTAHMAGNRLLVFARKPAPVQATWLAYPSTTGLDAIDYRITDPFLDLPGADQSLYSETSIRLPDCYWLFNPMDDSAEVNSLPAGSSGVVTFGSLNPFCKVNDEVLELWTRVLQAVPRSNLLVLAGQGRQREHVIEIMGRMGINPERIRFEDRRPRSKYLELHHQLDIVLDPFPWNGHTTSLDALWMGVPVITLTSDRAIGRGGLSLLSNLDLPELVAYTHEDYVRIAVALAGDVSRLSELRTTLRSRMQGSPLMNAARFARNMEQVFGMMWTNRPR